MSKLTLVARRAIRDELEPRIAEFEALMAKLFGTDFTAEYDVPAILHALEAHYAEREGEGWTRWYAAGPACVGAYFAHLAKELEGQKFGSDEMLREGFLEAVSKRIVRFEIVPAFPTPPTLSMSKYHQIVVEDGVLRLLTTVDRFGANIQGIADSIIGQL